MQHLIIFVQRGGRHGVVLPSAASDNPEARSFFEGGTGSTNCPSKRCLRLHGGALVYASPASLTRAGLAMQARRNTALKNKSTLYSVLESPRPPFRNQSSLLICQALSRRHIRLRRRFALALPAARLSLIFARCSSVSIFEAAPQSGCTGLAEGAA